MSERMTGMGLAAYSLASGFTALVAGAAVSLLTTGTARIIVWCVAAAVVSIAAGVAGGR